MIIWTITNLVERLWMQCIKRRSKFLLKRMGINSKKNKIMHFSHIKKDMGLGNL